MCDVDGRREEDERRDPTIKIRTGRYNVGKKSKLAAAKILTKAEFYRAPKHKMNKNPKNR